MNEDQGTLAATAALEGDHHLAAGRLAEAIAAYDRAVKRAPRQIDYRYKRAMAKARAGLLTEARTELEVIVELEPDHPGYRAALEHLTLAGGYPATTGTTVAASEPVVLVVDDDEAITGAVADRLQAEGWRVRRAHTLEEALVLGTQRPLPNAVVYDYYMGEITGLEVREELSYLLEQEGAKEPPYVMLTARNNPVTQHYAARRGAQAYVLKMHWLDPDVGLTAAVRKVLHE
jgi:CheY-like chemotaxis protein